MWLLNLQPQPIVFLVIPSAIQSSSSTKYGCGQQGRDVCRSGAATGAGSLGSGGGLDMFSDKAAVRVMGGVCWSFCLSLANV